MKICGLITEYNPFHNGHIHHMREARRLSGCDYLIVVMSGNFVQRGAPAVIDKYSRAEMALESGADLILELPALFSVSSAETFAFAAVSLLTKLGAVDCFVFGSEAGSLGELQKAAHFLNHEPVKFREKLRELLKSGMSYPAARERALAECAPPGQAPPPGLLDRPNNVLGIEYLRALETLGSRMEPMTIPRMEAEHHGERPESGNIASAEAIRRMLLSGAAGQISAYVSPYSAELLSRACGRCCPVTPDDFSALLQYRLTSERERLPEYLDFSAGLADRARGLLPRIFTFTEWNSALKTRGYTYTRVSRALLHLLLNMKEQDLLRYREDGCCLYARILGFRRQSAPLFRTLGKSSGVPLISRMADAEKLLSPRALSLLSFDTASSDIYRNAVYQKFGTLLKDEYSAGLVIL